MTTSFSAIERRIPLQDRAHTRIEAILVAAEQIFLSGGYEPATMTDVSAVSKTSPGGLYRYFPDKASIARALLARYDDQVERRWIPILASADRTSVEALVEALLGEIAAFSAECPVFLVLVKAPIKYRRDNEARKGLRTRLSDAFVAINGSLDLSVALVISNIFVETVKGMLSILSEVSEDVRPTIVAHYERLLGSYLKDALG